MIDQLAGYLAGHLLKPLRLSMAEFLMLVHFSHRPNEGKTISQISQARQLLQPGVTKIIQRLERKKWLRVQIHPDDARSKFFYLTPLGARLYAQAVARLMPTLHEAFSHFTTEDRSHLFDQLNELKQWFDSNRPKT